MTRCHSSRVNDATSDALFITVCSLRLPTPTAQDERHVYLVGLVVEAERVHCDVDAQAECHLTLLIAPWVDFVLPFAKFVARPGAAEIVLRIKDHHSPVVRHPF